MAPGAYTVPGTVDKPLNVSWVAVGKFHSMYPAAAFWMPLKFGGDQVKLFPAPVVSMLTINGMVAAGVFLNCRMEMLASLAAHMSSRIETPYVLARQYPILSARRPRSGRYRQRT